MSQTEGANYTCDRCGFEVFLSKKEINEGLSKSGIYKISTTGQNLHFCQSCFNDFIDFLNNKKEQNI